jgi:hypothetical protein
LCGLRGISSGASIRGPSDFRTLAIPCRDPFFGIIEAVSRTGESSWFAGDTPRAGTFDYHHRAAGSRGQEPFPQPAIERRRCSISFGKAKVLCRQ